MAAHTSRPEEISLMDQLLLLSIADDRGTIETPVPAGIVLAGAALVELALRDRVRIADGAVHPVRETPTGDPLLDTIAARCVRETPQPCHVWILRAHRRHRLEAMVLSRLERRRLLERGERRVLRFFRVCSFVLLPAAGETRDALRGQLRAALAAPLDAQPLRPACLAALLLAAGMLPTVLGTSSDNMRELRLARARELVENNTLAPAYEALAQAARGVRLAVEATLMSTFAGGTGTIGVGWAAQHRPW
ncbi:MAG: hypothetical protein Kow0010_01880 [Dehalococcoidia bacterium]